MKKALFCFVWFFSTLGPLGMSQDNSKAIYKDPNATISDRVHDLLNRMTVEEKVAQLESQWTLPSFGSFKAPSPFDGDKLNEPMVKKMLGNGIGTLPCSMNSSRQVQPTPGGRHSAGTCCSRGSSRIRVSVFRSCSMVRRSTVP